MKTIFDIEITNEDLQNVNYKYQLELTSKLDGLDDDFNQEIINEIVLWKVNRYSFLDDEKFSVLNKINKEDLILDVELTTEILTKFLNTKGIQLPMASTILRFKNPNIYQIIDQRVYRFIYGIEMPKYFSSIEKQIDFYIEYLQKLKQVCIEKGIDFNLSDRIIYELDKLHNKEIKIKY
jgi:hypothetical protein